MAALFLSLFTLDRPWPQYYLTFLPLVAVVAGHGVARLTAANVRVTAVVLLVGAAPAAYHLLALSAKTNERKLAMVEHVLEVTDSGDPVHDGFTRFNVFRPDTDWFWFSVGKSSLLARYRRHRPYPYDAHEIIERVRPAVVSTLEYPEFPDTKSAAAYRPSPVFPELYLRADLAYWD